MIAIVLYKAELRCLLPIKAAILALALVLVLIVYGEMAEAAELTDQAGRRVRLPEKIERVVSLAPSLTEIIYALGQEKRLVGTTQFSDYPAAAASLPKVGSYARLDLERIVALRPDLCFAIKDGNPRHQVERLEALGIPVYVIDPRDLAGVMAAIEGMGAVLRVEPQARRITGDMAARLARIKKKVAGEKSRPGVFFQVDAAPIITAGSGTFIDELITLAGGVNLGAGPVPYPRLSWERVISLRPEVVVVSSMAGGQSRDELLAQWHRWPQVPAVRQGRLFVVDAGLFDRPTPRLISALEALAALIHPELFQEGGNGR